MTSISNGTECASGETIDNLIKQIEKLGFMQLAMTLYREEAENLTLEQRKKLVDIVVSNGGFLNLYALYLNFSKPEFVKELEGPIIEAFFELNCKEPVLIKYEKPTRQGAFPPIEFQAKNEQMFRDFLSFFEKNYEICDPNKAIEYGLALNRSDQDAILIRLAALENADKDAVRNHLISEGNLIGLIAFYTSTWHIEDAILTEQVLKAIDRESEKAVLDLHIYNAILLVRDKKSLEELCGAFVSTSHSSFYASLVAKKISSALRNYITDEASQKVFRSFLTAMEDICIENSGDSVEDIHEFVKEVESANKIKLYKAALKICQNTNVDIETRRTNNVHLNVMALYVPLKDRLLCRLNLYRDK